MRSAKIFCLLLAISPALGVAPDQVPAAAPSQAVSPVPTVDLLPEALRAKGAAILEAKDDAERAKLAKHLAEDEPERADAFLVALLDHDGSAAVREEIVDELGNHPSAEIRSALERHAASDPSLTVALLALDRVHERSTLELRGVLDQRLALAKKNGSAEEVARLVDEEERWISLVRGTMLPSFLRQPGALAVKPAGGAIRVVAFGDFGDGSASQRATAAAMRKEHARRPFDFGLTLGDNFYKEGSESPHDPRWKSWWEDLYGPMDIRFYAVLGNHDWELPDSPAAEILYSGRSKSWEMPSPYYTFTAGDVQFFGVDTNEVSERQLEWLEHALDASTAKWKVVYGHHPIYSAGEHGDTPVLVERLLPVLRNRADVYLCGHDHDMQHLKPDGGVHFFVAGAGGAHQRPMHPHPRSLFAKTDVHGFAVIEADRESLSVRFLGDDGRELYRYKIEKELRGIRSN